MNDVVIELTERVRKDYRVLPKPVQKNSRNSFDSSLKTFTIHPFIFIVYAAAATTGSFT